MEKKEEEKSRAPRKKKIQGSGSFTRVKEKALSTAERLAGLVDALVSGLVENGVGLDAQDRALVFNVLSSAGVFADRLLRARPKWKLGSGMHILCGSSGRVLAWVRDDSLPADKWSWRTIACSESSRAPSEAEAMNAAEEVLCGLAADLSILTPKEEAT